MRTQAEIVEYIREKQKNDLLPWSVEVAIYFLDFEHAKEFLKTEATAEKWGGKHFTETEVLAEMKNYMDFAWSKVEDHRGLSADRSISKMLAWLWVLGDDELNKKINDGEIGYAMYGAPILDAICQKYGFTVPASMLLERMRKGEPCSSHCCGCGCGEEDCGEDE